MLCKSPQRIYKRNLIIENPMDKKLVCQNAVTVCQFARSYGIYGKPKSQDMQSFDKICHAINTAPNHAPGN